MCILCGFAGGVRGSGWLWEIVVCGWRMLGPTGSGRDVCVWGCCVWLFLGPTGTGAAVCVCVCCVCCVWLILGPTGTGVVFSACAFYV